MNKKKWIYTGVLDAWTRSVKWLIQLFYIQYLDLFYPDIDFILVLHSNTETEEETERHQSLVRMSFSW